MALPRLESPDGRPLSPPMPVSGHVTFAHHVAAGGCRAVCAAGGGSAGDGAGEFNLRWERMRLVGWL